MNSEMPENIMSPATFSGWFELSCWTTVALAPFLYWVNGPAVSTDQLVVRTTLVILALCSGFAVRVTKWIRRCSFHNPQFKDEEITDEETKYGSGIRK